MCFSAPASFVAGTVLSIGGGITIKKAKIKSEIPFAIIPLLFGIQQLIEGVVWLSFSSPSLPWLNPAATFVYAILSHVLWPVFLPLAVLLLEKNRIRRKILSLFLLIGTGFSLYLLYILITIPVTSVVINHSIAYSSPHVYPYITTTVYLVATCVSCLFSSHRMVNIFGIALLASFIVSIQFFYATFFSVWCFFAAILSIIVYVHFALRKT